jgi:transcriptional regulator with XRE-family HTH domain
MSQLLYDKSHTPKLNMESHQITLKKIGANIRQVRLQKNICLEYLGKKIGLSKSGMSRLENGKRDTTLEKFLTIAKHLKIDAKDLLF